VLFELITKVPLFPGRDEMDQVHRIHNVFGTPKPEILERFKSRATHMEFNFPAKKGIGLEKLLPPNTSHDIKDLLEKLLAYDANERITAEEALRHEFFAEFSHLVDKKKDFRSTISIMRQNHNEKS